jgi:uncharacterized protein (UPF0262 family)
VSGDDDQSRIAELELDTGTILRWNPEVEHERQVAMFDLLERNLFALEDSFCGPYHVELSLDSSTLVFRVRDVSGDNRTEIKVSVRPFRTIIKDYFLICDSYFQAIKTASPSRIEAIDMGRRGLHNEGAQQLADALDGRIRLDDETARRLFTLICVLHLRG